MFTYTPPSKLPDVVVNNQTDIESVSGVYKSSDNPTQSDSSENNFNTSSNNNNPSSNNNTPPSDDIESNNDDDDEDLAAKQLANITFEKWYHILIQVSIPFFIAGAGTIGAGVVLGTVESWEVFRTIPQLFIVVPALLGLKGNLDMTLASRLCTQANLGNMKSKKEAIRMIFGNIAIVQVQATVASLIISMFALSVGLLLVGPITLSHALLLTASAMFTATTSCFVLDFVLVGVILVTHKYKINPDNMATPLAASIGDLIAITMLSISVALLYINLETHLWVTYTIISFFFLILPMWIYIVLKNEYVRPVLKTGWVPVISALFISGASGIILEQAVQEFSGFVVFQPIINGIGGNLVSVHASKMATSLHQSVLPGIVPAFTRILEYPWRALFFGTIYAKTARILILLSIPGNILFIFIADFIHMWESTIGAPFVFTYIFVSLVQIMTILYVAHVIIHAMWKHKMDPDTQSIPYLTALGDFLGTLLLWGAFIFLRAIGHEYKGRPDDIVTFLI